MKKIAPFEKLGELSDEDFRELQGQTMRFLSSAMAQRGPLLRHELQIHTRTAHGRDPTSGHMADLLMNCAARMEASLANVDPVTFLESVASVLCLARDLAYAEGKIKAAPSERPS